MPIIEANPALSASPELIELASIVEPILETTPQNRPHIDEVKVKLETLCSKCQQCRVVRQDSDYGQDEDCPEYQVCCFCASGNEDTK
jgi:hypothetical protein